MQLVCKFVPGNAVSRDVLDYILSPDECIGQLSRTRNLQDVLRQLPKPLSDTIPQSAKKDIHSLLSNIKQRLVRVEWVALSSFARRTPLSDAQLQAYPALKMRVDEFASEQPKKVVKANYDTVTDDVPLARNLSFTPVEPSPDKKIVVEFAGQWPNNAAYLMLSETGTQKEKVAKPRKDSSKNHRSVSVFKSLEEEPRNLYLAIPLSGSATPLKLLLAENVEPVDSSDEMDEWDNVLVPVRPLAYLDGSKSKDKASELRGGYLYVFWKGKLWREMAITDKGYYQDVDVEYYRSLYQEEQTKEQPKAIQREAEGVAMPQFWVPYKVLGEVQEGENGLKVIFSPKQKRFNQIESLESDTALLEKSSTPLDELSHYSSEQAFSTQEFTSDVASAKVHAINEDDMPWLSDQQVLVRSYDQSNTVIAYVDGKNNGLLFRVDVGTSGITALNSLYIVDHNSEYKDVFELELFHGEDHDWQQALLSGLPPEGIFTISLVCDQDQDSRHILFDQVVYQDLFAEPEGFKEPEPAKHVNEQPKMASNEEKQRFESLMLDWSL
ncbi:hypothetical protein ACXAAV_21350 [Vibrio coralliilyticus]